MAVPNSMADLATLAGSNSPAGSEAIGNSLDDYLRAHAAIIRSTNALSSATIAAATTTDVATADGEYVQITGAATITSLGSGFAGCRRELRFTGVCTLTHSGNLILPGATNIQTASGDALVFRCLGSGQWVMIAKSRVGSADVTAAIAGYLTVASSSVSRIDMVNSGASVSAKADLVGGGYFLGTTSNTSLQFIVNDAIRGGFGTDGVFTVNNQIKFDTNLTSTGVNMLLGPTGAGTVYFRPNGIGSGAGQFIVESTGNTTTSGNAEISGSATIGGGKKLAKITVSSSAPGALVDGELYLRY